MAGRLRAAAALTLLLAVADWSAHQPLAAQANFRAAVDAVSLDVSVTTGGKPVRGLTAADFSLTDGGQPQRVDSAALETLPLSILLVLDTSGSVAGEKQQALVEAGRALVAAMRPGDRISLLTFAANVAVQVPLTGERAQVTNALASLHAAGATSLRDAIYTALQLAPADRTRPVVLVFSDGRDTASWLSSDDALAAVRRSGVVVHAVELVEDEATARRASTSGPRRTDTSSIPPRQPASAFIGEIVAASGGRRWSAAAPVRLPSLFTDALNEMRARYVLTYTPTITAAGWHPVTVRVSKGRVEVTHRPGYLVPARP